MTYTEFKSRVISVERAYYKSICQLSLADFIEQADKLADQYIVDDVYHILNVYMSSLELSTLEYAEHHSEELLDICKDFKAIKAGVVRKFLSNLSSNSEYARWLDIKRDFEG